MKNKQTVVLAFSGGLDTSFCALYLANEKNLDVHAVAVNTGGFSPEDIKTLEQRAHDLGISHFTVLDKTEEFYKKAIRYLLFGNVLKNQTYPLSVSAERVFQAMAIARYAREKGASYIAHGSTGAGNDQVRFDFVFKVMAPGIEILTPIRDLSLSRTEEIEYLRKNGINLNWEKAKYSINKGLWGTSVGGAETLTSHLSLPESAWPVQASKTGSETLSLYFEKGECTGFNEYKNISPVEVIRLLHHAAAPYGVGRDIHIGDTIIGIKGRVGFEAAAPLLLIKAHHLLEKHILSKWQQHWKQQLADWYGMLMHEGQYLDPVMRNIEVFLESTQEHISGTVHVALHPFRFELIGCESPNDLMQSGFGQYGEMNAGWKSEDVKGFTTILANATRIYTSVHDEN